jgi:uncharacterized membrane protein YkoI
MDRLARQLGLLVGAILLGGGVASAAEREALPPKVAAAIKAAYPAGRITETERKRQRGAVIYEVELQLDGVETELKVDAAGVIGSIETEMAEKDAPEAIVSACRRLHPGARIKEVERREIHGVVLFTGFSLLKEPCVVYEVEMRVGDGDVELLLDASGKVLRGKSDSDDDDGDDNEHEDDD